MRQPPSAWKEAKVLYPYLKQMRPFTMWLGLGALLSLVTLASSIGMIALSGWFLSASAVAGLSAATAASFNYFLPSAGIRLFVLTRTAGRYGERLASHEGTLRLLSLLRKRVYEVIEPLSPAALLRHGSGDLLTRLTADIDALDSFYLRVLVPTVVALLAIIGCGVLIGFFAPWIGLFAGLALLLSGMLGPWLAWRFGHTYSSHWQAANGTLRTRLAERLITLPELLLYGRWHDEVDTLLKTQRHRDNDEWKLARLWGASQLMTHTLQGLTLTITFALAAWLASQDRLDPTLIALIGLAILAAFEAIALLPQAWQNLGRVQHAAQRLEALRTQIPAIEYPQTDLASPADAGVEIEHLDITFPDGTQALSNASLMIDAGEHIALLGPSGGGKTTLLNALVRFVEPQRGELRLGGVSLDKLSEHTLRQSFAVAPQDVHLFVASFRENLLLAAPDATDTEMEELLTALDLGEWLDSQPQGLDSYPDESGRSLSGGELRRFGIARALLSPAPVVLLDEPTEGLDEATASHVITEIRHRCQGRTLLMITHRPTHAGRLDRVAILDAGHLIESGKPQELLEQADSHYAALNRHIPL